MQTRGAPPPLPLLLLPLLLLPAARGVHMLWQLSDVHVDGEYAATGAAAAWCRPETAGQGSEHWFGQPGCGLPWRTVQSAVDTMRANLPGADAVLWTGDTAPHWPYPDWTHVFPKLRRLADMLRTAFPEAQIVPVIGNHDAYPSDQFPSDNGTFYHEYLEQSGWSELLPESARRTFRRGGYYAVDVGDLRVIVLNTALYYYRNRDLRHTGDDPAGQLAWLDDQLAAGRPTIVTAHISPGFHHGSVNQTSLRSPHNYQLWRRLNRAGLSTRIANIFGHEHMDTFQNVYRRDIRLEQHTSALNTYFMGPSLYPGARSRPRNPGVRVYTVVSDRVLNDYIQYHFDLDAANRAHLRDPEVSPAKFWNITYRMRQAYGLNDLTTMSMHLLFKMMKEDDAVFKKYWRFAGGLHDQHPACDAKCKKERLCIISTQVDAAMEECLAGVGQLLASLGLVLAAGLLARLAA
ncbi:acid sphingomyelinase-like phosphodiesterase 3a [Pollicipes pollicipes]|uniref:acid sphingomyelinase-like phosphodiesterase 3a n=1 Tax=Pollicipes pollicipes TaxID=41117 RepID=UPI0018851DB5|nr:acid sphingomyelinase-like phosphodiesterase 3a [Pollicipes pollicipes]